MKFHFIGFVFLFFFRGFLLMGQDSNSKIEIHPWETLADSFQNIGKWDSSSLYYNRAIGEYEVGKSWERMTFCYLALSINNYQQDDYLTMEASLNKANSTIEINDLENDDLRGFLYANFSAFWIQMGDYDQALEYAFKGMKLHESMSDSDPEVLATENLSIGLSYKRKGDFDRAIEYYYASLNLLKGIESPNLIDGIYNNLGNSLYRKKDFPKAIFYNEKRLDLLSHLTESTSPREFVLAFNNLAIIYIDIGQYDKALSYLVKAESYADQTRSFLQNTLHNLSYVYRMKGDFDLAENYLEQAIEVYNQKNRNYRYHSMLGKAQRHLGYIDVKKANLVDALNHYQSALMYLVADFEDSSYMTNPPLKGFRSQTELLKVLRVKGEALSLLAEDEPDRSGELLGASLMTSQLAIALLDTMRLEYQESSKEFWVEEVRPVFEQAIAVAVRLYDETGDQTYLEQAFRLAEKSKASLLAEAVQESAAKFNAGIPEELIQQEKDLKIDMAFYKKQIFNEEQKGVKRDSVKILLWKSKVLDRRTAYESLLAELEMSYPEYYQLKYANSGVTLAEIQASLSSQTQLIEYVFTKEIVYAFSVTQDQAEVKAIPLDDDFAATFDGFINGLRDEKSADEKGLSKKLFQTYAQQAHELYGQLLAPVHQSKANKLMIIPDGILGYLPFELLLTEKPESTAKVNYAALPYLLKSAQVRYEYSAALMLQPLSHQETSQFYIGFAPVYGADESMTSRDVEISCEGPDLAKFATLKNNGAEVRGIHSLISGKAFIGTSALESVFKEEAPQSKILHLAMHGFINDCDPMYSGLAFAASAESQLMPDDSTLQDENEGLLFAYEIYNQRLNAELAVLSACNTGSGQLASGEGIMSLARAFKYAGCPNILMSLWKADDQATGFIMQEFYTQLDVGKGKDEALQQAKIAYLNSPGRKHPYYWGAFVLIGDETSLNQASFFGNYRWIIGIALIILLGGLYWNWKRRNS